MMSQRVKVENFKILSSKTYVWNEQFDRFDTNPTKLELEATRLRVESTIQGCMITRTEKPEEPKSRKKADFDAMQIELTLQDYRIQQQGY